MKEPKKELTPEAMLADMGLHARSSVVHVEPTTVAEWRECIGHVLCGAAFDAGLAQALADRSSRDMYAKAWEREIGPPYRQKTHHIDAMVLTTEDRMRQLRGLRSALKVLVESYQVKETKVSASWLSDAKLEDFPPPESDRFPGRGSAWRNALDALRAAARVP